MKNTSIRFRLMVLMICLTTLPVITMTWIATHNTKNSVEKEIIDANVSRMMWANQYLDELIQQLDALFYTLHINDDLITKLSQGGHLDVGNQLAAQNSIRNTLNSTFYSYSRKIDKLTIYTHSNQRAFTVDYANTGLTHSLDISEGQWRRMLSEPVSMYFKASSNGVNVYHSMNEFIGRKLIGGIAIQLNKHVWEQAGYILQSEPESAIYLINDEGELLPGSSPLGDAQDIRSHLSALDTSDVTLALHKTLHYYFFTKRVNSGQLHIVKAIPLETIHRSANATMKAGMWTGALFALASIVISILVSLWISRPIVSLAKTMRKWHVNNFEMKSVKSKDEIGLLESGYNFMMLRIKTLIEVEYQRELELKNAQLFALQAQINPHFINNTLHLIGGMALHKDAPEIYRITHIMGDLLRYAINMEGELVSLSEEIKHMENLIFIQEQRFTGRFTATVSEEALALNSMMPRFILQPIVENCFEHGLSNKEGKWTLEIRTRQIGNRIVVIIKDDGIGMSRAMLLRIRAELRHSLKKVFKLSSKVPKKRRRGIGLLNVHNRLVLQFGDRYGLRIFSTEGEGTIVIVTLPITSPEDDDVTSNTASFQERGGDDDNV